MKFDISNDEIGLAHHDKRLCGRVFKWSGTDTLALFEKNSKDPKTYELLKMHGWLDPECITYKYNKHGFRDEEFDDRPAGIALGCSYTEGVGVPEHTTWGNALGRMLGMHMWNLGVGGGSLDTVFRVLEYWLPKLTPKFVAICIPSVSRMEVFRGKDPKGNDRPINVGPWPCAVARLDTFYQTWIVSDANMIMLRRKNLLAIQQLCDQANIPLVMKDEDVMIDTFARDTGIEYSHEVRVARDLSHPGVQNHDYFAQQIYNNLPTEIKK
jgi:hypothetical protein